ncbi:MAG TPA: asparaginase [Candidatus Limnocylindrales bacterium]|nr:asparaginase [Candidatus Limnocylindrales bacterium]
MATRTPARTSRAAARPARWTVPPVLVRQERAGTVESVHRGDIVEVDLDGRAIHALGDPERLVNLRSAVKPFGIVALLRAGGLREFDLTPDEIAVMVSSHSGEDLHVRTILAMYRRIGIAQGLLSCSSDPTPLDALTATRLARDGERPSQLRHMCSGQHSAFLLLAKLGGWPLETYWQDEHPVNVAYAETVAELFGVRSSHLVTSIDACGLATFAFPLRQIARAYAMLADPEGLPAADPRAAVAKHLLPVRDAMVAHPELVAGTRDRLDTSVMKAVPGGLVAKGGAEGLSCIGILPGARGAGSGASGLAVKIEDGGGYDRAEWAATVEALRQVGLLGGHALRMLARFHRPPSLDPHGRIAGEAVPGFELAPVGELTA